MVPYLDYTAFLLLSGVCLWIAERLWPRDPAQKLLRRGLPWEVFLFILNTEVSGSVAAIALARSLPPIPDSWRIRELPSMALELLLLWIAKDLVQYGVHILMHRVPLLWRIHRMHHTAEQLSWISNWRFHPLESLVYQAALYLPAAVLGFRPLTLILCAFISTGIGHFAHANLRVHLGPLRYLINTPEMHVWHHVHPSEGPLNRNFGISLSLWDWIFGTAHCPPDPPAKLGTEPA